jgi:amidase
MSITTAERGPGDTANAFIGGYSGGDTPDGILKVGIKDVIDLAGSATTAGSEFIGGVVVESGAVANTDADCLAGIREAEIAGGVAIIGKTNLNELAFGSSGLNRDYGNPVNPADNKRIPGGSSSGSAVAVAMGLADVALGTDTGGSIRGPAACCNVAGLKTSRGRISLDGVYPLAPSMDTVGPLARDVGGLIAGMELLENGFAVPCSTPETIGQIALDHVDPQLQEGVRQALHKADLMVLDEENLQQYWDRGRKAASTTISAEAAEVNQWLEGHWGELESAERLHSGQTIAVEQRQAAGRDREVWAQALDAALQTHEVLALPTLDRFPPTVTELARAGGRPVPITGLINPINLTPSPAVAIPIPGGSLQLVGRPNGEEVLLATAKRIESAVASTKRP